MDKFCKDCKHYYSITDIENVKLGKRKAAYPEGYGEWPMPTTIDLPPECRHEKSYHIRDMVRGQIDASTCYTMRDNKGFCGPEGMLWEDKNG